MTLPILATKLFIPPLRPTSVQRPRLVERLNAGLHRKVTLISALAGCGKTTLVSEWLASLKESAPNNDAPLRKVAWLSLDEADSDPARFLSYLVAALRTIAPALGEGVLAGLQSPQPPPIESMLAALLNEIASVSDLFVLVLDDYHLIDAKAVDDCLAFLIEHLPPQLHLVITTREDPRLPLARLRARNQLTELRGVDLRFTPSEAAQFLRAMNLNVSVEDVAALEKRTEGWIAGLQLAALSMQGQQDVSGFVRAFAGDHRYVVDYLVEEVLLRQPEAVRRFLLQTAILDELTASLCDAVTGQTDSKTRLEALERGNFFVVPLDDKRQWYRYHHLFADVLRVHLLEEQPDLVATLHRRASVWYEQQGSPPQAIRHALAAGDFERMADLVELAIVDMNRNRQETTLLGWFRLLPDELVRARPVLSLGYVGTLLSNGQIEGVERRLRDVEEWLERSAATDARPPGMVVVDEEAFRQLPGTLAIYRSGEALALGRYTEAIRFAQRALGLFDEGENLWRGAALAIIGLATWAGGELESGYRFYADGMASLQRAGNISDVVGGSLALADIRITQGRLRQAMAIYTRALQLATEQGAPGKEYLPTRFAPVLRGTADMYVGMAELYREGNDLEEAAAQLARSKALGDAVSFPQNPYRWRVAMARLQAAQGDLNSAIKALDEAQRLYVSDLYPDVRPVAAWKARMWIAQGRLSEAHAWAHEQGLSAQDELSYLREFEHITLARVLIASYKSDHTEQHLQEAVGLLDRLLAAAQAGGRMGNVIDILVVQALAYQAQGDNSAALTALHQALTLAEPEGYVRIFVDEGQAMVSLLRVAFIRGIVPTYTAKLLEAVDGPQTQSANEVVRTPSPLTQQLPEPLSERELEVLRLFATELSGPEIANRLVIALSTLRTHTKGIFGKLNVNSRREAVSRAQELNLI